MRVHPETKCRVLGESDRGEQQSLQGCFTREDLGLCSVPTASESVLSLLSLLAVTLGQSLRNRAPAFVCAPLGSGANGLVRLLPEAQGLSIPLVPSIYFEWGKLCVSCSGFKEQKPL